MSFKLAHISDIHFFHLRKSPLQFFSKVFCGNLNHFFKRRSVFCKELPYQAAKFFKSIGVTHILITGDFTCTTSKKELALAKTYLEFLKNEGFTVYTFPGNHDVYTKKADETKLFYHTLSHLIDFHGDGPFNLIDDRVASYTLTPNWHLVTLDCALSVPMAKATGLFDTATEKKLMALLASLPLDASILLTSHFPYRPHNYPKHHLDRGDALKKLISNDKRIKAYIHGHRHELELSTNENHIVVESGSIAIKKRSTFSLIELDGKHLNVMPYIYRENTWEKQNV